MFGLKKKGDYLTDEQFQAASEKDIFERLETERILKLDLFTKAQRNAILTGQWSVRQEISAIVPIPVVEAPQSVSLLEPAEVPEPDNNNEIPLSPQEPAIEAADVLGDDWEKDKKAILDDVDLMSEKRLRELVRLLRANLQLEKKKKRPLAGWGWYLLASISFSVSVDYLMNRHNAEVPIASATVPDQLNYEEKRAKHFYSNFLVSEYYRQTDNCHAGIDRILLESQNLNLSGIQNKAKTPAVCQQMADYEAEIDEVFLQCTRAVAYKTDDVIEPRIAETIEKSRASLNQSLAKLPKEYQNYLKGVGYDQCKKVLAKKK